MASEQDKHLYETLTQTARLLQSIQPVEGEEYTLESILAEYGSGAAEPVLMEPEMPEAEPEETVKRADSVRRAEKKEKKAADLLADTQRIPKVDIVEVPLKKDTPSVAPEVEEEPVPCDNTPPDRVLIRDVMRDTVDQALAENEDGILPPRVSLKERLQEMLSRRRTGRKRAPQDTEQLWEEPDEKKAEYVEPEPDSDSAARYERRRSKHLRHFLVMSAVPMLVLLALTVMDLFELLPSVWWSDHLLRCSVLGGLLLVTALFSMDVWRSAAEKLKSGRVGCELAAAVVTVVTLANCVGSALTDDLGNVPFAVCAAVMIWLCQWGLLQRTNARREAFHLANMGGKPPYVASVIPAGACKQRGKLSGFYRLSDKPDPAAAWQNYTVPLLLAAATVLTGVVVISGQCAERFLWIWSAMLCAAVPLALPLQSTLVLSRLQHRLSRSGSAVAGYAGIKALNRSRRLILTEADLFPPGTVEFNGYKVFGEERRKMLSYAATMANAAHSQLYELFAQQLAAEGGFRAKAENLEFYEEGGISATIRGETVMMGSLYFMRKRHVDLPHDLKLQTGVFLAVDGVLGAIFVIKYQPSRNVEWALQALKRAHMPPVLAVRSGNVTPGLLKRKFRVDCKPIYPDVTTRLALSGAIEQTGEEPYALLYREGLMPLTETVIGARRAARAIRISMILSYLGSAAGLLLTYYLTSVASYGTLTPLYMLAYGVLWLLPTLLLSGSVKHF